MSAQEIKALRQAGRLEEALAMAEQELNANPDNIWGKRNISWVYYEYLKKYAQNFNYIGFADNLTKLKELDLPEGDVMVFDNSAYQIGSLLFKIAKEKPINHSKVNTIFDLIKDFHFTKPSDSYSFLINAFHSCSNNWSRFIELTDWWGLNNFMEKDFQEEEYNQRKISALADKVYSTYAKSLAEGEATDAYGTARRVDKDKINSFLPHLDQVIDAYSNYRYLSYYKAQLLLAIGDEDNVLEAFLPFAKQKQNDFWVWSLMAEIFKEDKELEFACYCKALSLRTRDEFLIKTRMAFAKLLIGMNLFSEAKTEIINIINVRQREGWRIPNKIIQWTESDWYKSAKELSNNKALYEKHKVKAEKLLYSDLPEHLVAVEFINHSKKILNFVKDTKFHGFFNYDGFITKPNIGEILKVRLEPVGDKGFHRVMTLETIEDTSILKLSSIKEVSGAFRIFNNNRFGFLEDVFVPPNIVESGKLINDQSISVKAILSFNKTKKEWGWKALEILNK